MVVVCVDLGRELVRPPFPDVVPEHRRVLVRALPFGHRDRSGRIATVTVRDQKPAKALSMQRVEDLSEDGAVRLQPQGRAAGKSREALRQPVRQHRQDGNPQRVGRFDGEPLRDDVVGLEREVRVLLGRADGQHDAVISLEVTLELHPVPLDDPHAETFSYFSAARCRS